VHLLLEYKTKKMKRINSDERCKQKIVKKIENKMKIGRYIYIKVIIRINDIYIRNTYKEKKEKNEK
jgi:hypothetical protein